MDLKQLPSSAALVAPGVVAVGTAAFELQEPGFGRPEPTVGPVTTINPHDSAAS